MSARLPRPVRRVLRDPLSGDAIERLVSTARPHARAISRAPIVAGLVLAAAIAIVIAWPRAHGPGPLRDSTGMTLASNSLVGNANLIKKVYFPRLAIPVATILSGLVDLVVALVVLLVLMLFYHIAPSIHAVALPIFLVIALAASLGVGFWLSALNVEYRDVRVVLPWVLQVAMYATPVVYPIAAVPEKYRWNLSLMYASQEAWEQDFKKIDAYTQKIEALEFSYKTEISTLKLEIEAQRSNLTSNLTSHLDALTQEFSNKEQKIASSAGVQQDDKQNTTESYWTERIMTFRVENHEAQLLVL